MLLKNELSLTEFYIGAGDQSQIKCDDNQHSHSSIQMPITDHTLSLIEVNNVTVTVTMKCEQL